jgi:predicted nucleic acid-binding protein
MLLDTTVLVDYLRGNEQARHLLEGMGDRPHGSVVSVLELFAGVRNRREERRTEQLLSKMTLLPVTVDIAKRAGVFVRLYDASHGIGAVDAIIAATAEHHGLRLATLNVKHFPMFPKLKHAY